MKTITVSEFRKNIRKYADIADTEKVIVNRGKGKAFAIIPIKDMEDDGYSPEFVKRILKAEKEIEKGNFVRIKGKEELKVYLENL